jgi:biopolymer transport protein ExbB
MGTIFAAGGIVMWPLLGFSIVAIALIIERSLFWFRINRRQRPVMQDILRTYRQAPVDTYPKLRRTSISPLARIFLEALEIEGASPKQFHLALASAMQAELPHLRRFSTVFATIISVAPLLGLLGTILGLIHLLCCPATGRPHHQHWGRDRRHQRSPGIDRRGLVVAIGTLIFANLFRGIYKRQMALIQEYGGQLEILYETHYERRAS